MSIKNLWKVLATLGGIALAANYIYVFSRITGLNLRIPNWDQAAHGMDAVYWAKAFASFNFLHMVDQLVHSSLWPPVVPLLQSIFLLVFGTEFAVVRGSVIVFSGLCMPLAVLAGLQLDRQWGWAAGLFAAVLLYTSRGFHDFTFQMMLENPGVFFTLPVLYFYFQYCNTKSDHSWRWTIITTTILFFTKFNYAILSSVPILFIEFTHNKSFRQPLLLQINRLRGMIPWRSPFMILVYTYAGFLLSIPLLGGYRFVWNDRVVEIQRAWGNPIYLLVAMVLVRTAVVARPLLKQLVGEFWNCADPYRSLNRYFVFPVALWMLYPAFFRTFFIFLFSESTRKQSFFSAETLSYYPGKFLNLYSPSPLVGVVVAGAMFGLACCWRWLDVKGRYLVVASFMGCFLVVTHPNYQHRYIITTLPMIFYAAGYFFTLGLRKLEKLGSLMTKLCSLLLVILATIIAFRYPPDRSYIQTSFEDFTNDMSLGQVFEPICDVANQSRNTALLGYIGPVTPAGIAWICLKKYPSMWRDQTPNTVKGALSREMASADAIVRSKKIENFILVDIDRFNEPKAFVKELDLVRALPPLLDQSDLYELKGVLYDVPGTRFKVTHYRMLGP